MRRIVLLLTLYGIVSLNCVESRPFIDSRLYFGLGAESGSIPLDTFQVFLDSVITPRFPDGLTRYAAEGQWKTAAGILTKEKSMVVEIVYRKSRQNDLKIEEIRSLYKKRFKQESVLLVKERTRASF